MHNAQDDRDLTGSTSPDDAPISPSDSEFKKQMEIAEDVMREFNDLLRKLGE